MTKLNEVYKCNVCGNIVEITHASTGTLVCCGKPMDLQKENSVDASLEKHVPIIEKLNDKIIVKVGSVEHPMEEKHYIEWVELVTENKTYKKFLKPNTKPFAEFNLTTERFYVRAYCNLHGLWRSENK